MGQKGQIAWVVRQEGDGRKPDGTGAVGASRARWPTREEMAGYRRARWQFLWVVGQEGRWQGSRWGRGSGGKQGQMAREEGDGRVQKGQMAVSVGGGAGGGMARSQMGQGKWGQGGPDGWRGRGWQGA